MPGYTKEMLSHINSKVDMNNKFQLLMNQVYDCSNQMYTLFLIQYLWIHPLQ